jgi:hypothetical protein
MIARMGQGASSARASASRVAKWLIAKGRTDDALSVLSAWAALGPNDAEGQALLAEALRIDPRSPLAKMAFERMEGMSGPHAPLDAAIARFSESELTRLEGEMSRPSFRRAQVGFNNNLKYKGHVFHVQTEDSGLDKPHIITHLFADGGRVIKSHKRSYADAVGREKNIALYVRALMKAQHMEMVLCLRDGKFDDILAGKAVGGLSVLEHPPNADVRKLAHKASDAPPPSVRQPQPPEGASARAAARVHLHVLRSLVGGPAKYEPPGDEFILGAKGAVRLVGERFCHPHEAIVRFKDEKLLVEDLEEGNGVFLRIRTPVELEFGDEFIVGDQLLRVESNPPPRDEPGPGPTYFYSSPQWASAFRIVQIFEGGAKGMCVLSRGSTLQIGALVGDMVLQGDPLVEDQHCIIEEQAGELVLTDLGSRTGVFVRIRGEQEIVHGDELVVGRTHLVVDMDTPKAQQTTARRASV